MRRVNPDSEEELRNIPRQMPYIVIVIDEVADLIMRMKKEIEGNIILLAQKSRAAGIHLILATQKPTVDVITGLIKSNLPARICFQVASRSDSAVVLDEKGAEKLLGMGDMLFLQPGTSTIIRAQGALCRGPGDRARRRCRRDRHAELRQRTAQPEDSRADRRAAAARSARNSANATRSTSRPSRSSSASSAAAPRYCSAHWASATARRARFIDYMAEDGIVGAYNGSNARQVLITLEEWEGRKRTAG